MSSCASVEQNTTGALPVGKQAEQESTAPALATSAEELARQKAAQSEGRETVLYRGSDRMVNLPAKQEPVKFVGDDVSLNFEQAPLSEVTHAVLGDILKLDYVVDHPIQGKVTLRTRTPIPRDQILEVLESLLKSNNTIIVRRADGRYLVTGDNQGSKLAPSLSNPGDQGAGYSTVIVPLQYISAGAMAEILRPVAEESAFVRIDNARNLLMLAGTREQIDGWLDMVGTFDVDQLKGMSVGLFPLENSSVEEVTAALDAMMGATEEGAGMRNLIRVVPVERLNSILIVTPRAHYLDSVQQWITRLDDAHHSEYDSRLYVYPVQNTTAKRLAELLNSIYAGGSGSTRTSGSGVGDAGGVAPGMSAESLGSKSGTSGASSSAGSSSANFQMDQGGREAVADVRVVADDENNALMIYASPMQYRIIESALKQLDVEATQILIEASIMEVSLTDQLRYGLEWTFNGALGNGYEGIGTLVNQGDASGPSSVFPGFSYVISSGSGNVNAILNALASDSLLNIISSPSVMVLDNQSAYIHVGSQVPIIDSQTGTLDSISSGSNDNFNRVTQSITYKDTGVKLEVTPSVNAGGLVTMEVKQSVTDVGTIDDATGQRNFLERNIQSKVAVRSGESVVLGGLIQENTTEGSQGLPWLHDIPVLGSLFGVDNSTSRRTELLVIITPRALYNAQELRDVSKEMRSRVRNLDLISVPLPAASVPAAAPPAGGAE
ncbi:type II secretion system secretin GspD [Haliea sp. E17]|uniref:type II secretion system secretin GspD n=1 Tax=Haliea sp. E17 TaxID=3401576 RepID=UPI003AAB5974